MLHKAIGIARLMLFLASDLANVVTGAGYPFDAWVAANVKS